MKKVAFIYDFDKTLSPKDMQEYDLIQDLGYQDSADFWQLVTKRATTDKCDPVLAYMLQIKELALHNGNPITKERLNRYGQAVEFFGGVEGWFQRMNAYAASLGLELEHYVISSGLYEIISHTKIAKYFKQVYACSYIYDEQGNAIWPRNVVNYTTKTQYLFRINKQVLDISDEASLNKFIPMDKRPIPFSRMAYFADGYTDIPVFRLIKEYGGYSVGVYGNNPKVVHQLIDDNRLSYFAKADYQNDSPLDNYGKLILQNMASQEAIIDFSSVHYEK